MNRLLGVALLAGLLAACNSGDSFLEWDEETAARLAAEEAAAEAAAERGRMTDEEILAQAQADAEGGAVTVPAAEPSADGAPAPTGGLQAPLALLAADGRILQGVLVRSDTGVKVVWADGVSCSGGLVQESVLDDGPQASEGTFALNCSDGTIWLGKYADLAPGQGAWAMRDASGAQARAVYGSDVPASPVDAPAFETIWASRATTPAG